jgi:hypothetical protein
MEKSALTRSFANYNYNNQVKEDEVGGACSPNGGKEKCL